MQVVQLRNLRLSAYIACRMGSESRCHFSSFTLDHARHRNTMLVTFVASTGLCVL